MNAVERRRFEMEMESSFNEIVCPIDTKWKFKKADLMDLKDTENGYLEGKCFYAFNIHGIQYFVRIFPYGHEDDRGQTFIFFNTNGSEERKIAAEFKISIKCANYSKKLNYVYAKDYGWGTNVCKAAEFFEYKSKYFINGEITIKVNGTFAICPNDTNKRNQSTAFIYLYINKTRVEAVFSYSVDSANFNYGTQHIFDDSAGRGIPLCSTQDLFDPLKGFVVDGFLTINFQGVLSDKNNRFITLNCKNGQKSAMKDDDNNFVIVAGEKEIQVHKQVLSDVSPVFDRMLESGMKEAIENKMNIKDFEFNIVDISIKICYGNSILLKYSLETLLSIYRFGDKYRISLIMDLIEEYLIKEISPMNIVYLIKFSSSDSFNIKKLHQSCIEFLIKCMKESTPIYAFESLDEKLFAAMILSFLRPNVDTHIADNSDDDLHTADSTLSTDTDDTDTDDDSLTEDTTVSLLTDHTDTDD